MSMTPFAWEAVAAGMDRVDEFQEYHEDAVESLGLDVLKLDCSSRPTFIDCKPDGMIHESSESTDGMESSDLETKISDTRDEPIKPCHDIEYVQTIKLGGKDPDGFFFNVRFESCYLEDAKMENCRFINVTFRDCTFNNTMWDSIFLRDVSFTDCVFDDDLWRNDKWEDRKLSGEIFQQHTYLGETVPKEVSDPMWIREQQAALETARYDKPHPVRPDTPITDPLGPLQAAIRLQAAADEPAPKSSGHGHDKARFAEDLKLALSQYAELESRATYVPDSSSSGEENASHDHDKRDCATPKKRATYIPDFSSDEENASQDHDKKDCPTPKCYPMKEPRKGVAGTCLCGGPLFETHDVSGHDSLVNPELQELYNADEEPSETGACEKDADLAEWVLM